MAQCCEIRETLAGFGCRSLSARNAGSPTDTELTAVRGVGVLPVAERMSRDSTFAVWNLKVGAYDRSTH
jgi:hypothetical protein